jgi:hypothetical protein
MFNVFEAGYAIRNPAPPTSSPYVAPPLSAAEAASARFSPAQRRLRGMVTPSSVSTRCSTRISHLLITPLNTPQSRSPVMATSPSSPFSTPSRQGAPPAFASSFSRSTSGGLPALSFPDSRLSDLSPSFGNSLSFPRHNSASGREFFVFRTSLSGECSCRFRRCLGWTVTPEIDC